MAKPLRKSDYYAPVPLKSRKECVRDSIAMRRNISEAQMDRVLADTFPCSDPPAWY